MISLPRWILGLAVALAFAAAGFGAPSETRVYVLFQPGAQHAARAAVQAAGGRVHHDFSDLGALAVGVPSAALAGLSRNPNILAIEEDPVRELVSINLSQTEVRPYGLDLVQAPDAVAQGATGAGVKVGVIDSGVWRTHEDLATVKISGEPGFDRDLDSHGTHVTGTIAATGGNSRGVVGVSPGHVEIYMVKVFGDTGEWIYSSDTATAANKAFEQGARIISMSLGGARASTTERRSFDRLYARGALLIAAAGNEGTTALSYPASYDSVISVAAVDAASVVADFSQKNAQVELAAPGVAVLSTTSYQEEAHATVAGVRFDAVPVEFSARPAFPVTAPLVNGGLGDQPNPAWAGKVVLVQRGAVSFYDKVRNVQNSGGVACIIYNNTTGALNATLGAGNSSTIPALGVTQADGQTLLTQLGNATTVVSTFAQPASGYTAYDGTSMATPHVSGVAALLWSKYPQATAAQLRQVLAETARDLGATGRDPSYGFGLVQAKAALDKLGTLLSNQPPVDGVAPVISGLTSRITNAKNGSFEITWTTDESARSTVTLGGSTSSNPSLLTSHRFTFRGSKGVTYPYTVTSTDAAGNQTTATGTHTN